MKEEENNFLITNEEINKLKTFSIDDIDGEGLETPDPQIKALLSTIKVPEPSEEAKTLFLNTAKKKLDEKLGRKNFLQQAKDKVDVYFIKRRHGIKLNTSEIIVSYSLISMLALSVLAPIVYHQIKKPIPNISKESKKIFQTNPTIYQNNTGTNNSNISVENKTNPVNELNISEKLITNKTLLEKDLKVRSNIKEIVGKNHSNLENLDIKKSREDLTKKEDNLSITANNLNPTINIDNPYTPNKADIPEGVKFLTRGQEKRTEQNLSNIALVSVLSLGTDDLSIKLEQEFIKAIGNNSKWKLIQMPKVQSQDTIFPELRKNKTVGQKPDAVFKIDKADGSLEFITRQGDILWQDQDYKENYKKYNNYVISIIQLLTEGR